VVKTQGKERANEDRFQCAQETDDIGPWQEENCRSAKAEMGEDQISEGRPGVSQFPLPVKRPPPDLWGGGLF
jgi:hypothetical protein